MKIFLKISALLTVLALVLSVCRCAKLDEFFGSGNTGDDTPSDGTNEIVENIDPRVAGVYNFLLVREGTLFGDAALFTLVQMNLPESTLAFFHIPKNLFIRSEGATSLESVYENEYKRMMALGMGSHECELGGAKAVSACLSENLCLPVDFHMVVSSRSIKEYVDFLDGIEINLPFDFTSNEGNTYPAGMRKLDSTVLLDFLNYEYFENTSSEYWAFTEVLAAIHKRICASLSSENIAIHMVQAKPMFATDLPSRDGYDIFFLRKLISISSASWSVTGLCTYPVSIASGDYEIIRYATALEQFNTFLSIYEDPIKAHSDQLLEGDKVLDANKKLTDTSEAILDNIYRSRTKLPSVYTADDVYTGKLEITRK